MFFLNPTAWCYQQTHFQKQPPEVFYKKGVVRNLVNIAGKHLRQGLLFNKVAGLRLWHRCFPMNFAKFLITPVLQNISGRLHLTVN